MLVIRLQKIGRRHQPSFRVVVSERRSKAGGPPVEDLGSYSTFTKKAALKTDRVKHWLGIGAKPSSTVWNLLVRMGIAAGPKIRIPIKKAKVGKGETAAAPAEAAKAS